MEYLVKDIKLWKKGEEMIYWAERHMPVLLRIRQRFKKEKPLHGIKIGASLHVTKETAVLVRTLVAGGAEVYLVPCNPLSTQDEVAAALANEGVGVYAWRGMNFEEYYMAIGRVIAKKPAITMDDGADLITTIHKIYWKVKEKDAEIALKVCKGVNAETLVKNIKGGTEETTTGVNRLKAMERDGVLLYPIIAVNESYTKYLFDNRYGTGQSTLDGILRATNVLIAGKTVVVCGYGWCGRGIALRARGLGAYVVVTEVNPIRALEAIFDGFTVTSLDKAAEIGDIFITATGNINVIRGEHIIKMKDGAILANAGHFNVEISLKDLEELSVKKRRIKENVEEYELVNGRKIYLLCEGRLVNLVAAEGHPSEVMDMSFSNQALAVEYLIKEGAKLKPKVYKLPNELDMRVAELKLEAMGITIDKLTEEQKKYLSSWRAGT
ncbi:MAG: adenosylhomocysteinase [Thermoprotei archaeon]|nr:MAG: adenosylhomocysteinase [Thermoprotei archaeon]RLE99562.1 MAG: adenosylhomocysteinase [Thermoprotei archaeon]